MCTPSKFTPATVHSLQIHTSHIALFIPQVIQALKSRSVHAAATVEPLLVSSRLKALRISTKLGGLELVLTRFEKARANLHASGGALIALRKMQAPI